MYLSRSAPSVAECDWIGQNLMIAPAMALLFSVARGLAVERTVQSSTTSSCTRQSHIHFALGSLHWSALGNYSHPWLRSIGWTSRWTMPLAGLPRYACRNLCWYTARPVPTFFALSIAMKLTGWNAVCQQQEQLDRWLVFVIPEPESMIPCMKVRVSEHIAREWALALAFSVQCPWN
jgi:hypothetical protein